MSFVSDVTRKYAPFLLKHGFKKVYHTDERVAYHRKNGKTQTVMEVYFGNCGKEGVAVCVENIIGNGHRFVIAHQFMVKDKKQFKELLLGFRGFVAYVVNA